MEVFYIALLVIVSFVSGRWLGASDRDSEVKEETLEQAKDNRKIRHEKESDVLGNGKQLDKLFDKWSGK